MEIYENKSTQPKPWAWRRTKYCYDQRGNVTQKTQLVVGTGPLVTNWALASNGGVASASSTDASGNYPVAAVNDGDRTGQAWGNGGGWKDNTLGVFPDYVQINFASAQFIDAAIVYSLQDSYANGVDPSDTMTFSLYGITAFHVDVLSNGVWTTMATVTGNNLVKRKVNFPLTYASAIRVYTDASADGQWSRLVEVEAGSDAHSLVTNSIYSSADRLNFLIYPSGDVVGYDRDATGRVTDVTFMAGDPVPLVSGVSYSPFGPVNTITFTNGRTFTKNYDKDYAISTIASSDPNGFSLNASVDTLGNLTGATASGNTRSYGYDAMYRLTLVKDGSGAQLEGYSYGATGDRLSKTLSGTTQTYTYSAPLTSHQLQSVAGMTRAYDANGNTKQIGSATFTYDDRNRLAAANGASYFYNGKGERVIKRVGSNDTIFTYSESGALLAEYASPFACPNSNYLNNPDYYNCDPSFNGLSWPTEYLWMDGTLIGVLRNGNLYYVETDQLGTPRAVIQPGYPSNDPTTGDKVVWKWDYAGSSAFGENAPNADPTNSGSAFTMNLRYPGQYFDPETGLHYNYFRDYEPATGRYVESDPIGLRGGITTYGYARSRPLSRIDPAGTVSFGPTCNTLQRALLMTALIDMEIELLSHACNDNCSSGRCMLCSKAKRILDWYKTTAVLHCNQSGGCAQSIFPDTTNLYFTPGYLNSYGGFFSDKGCGCLPSALLHEGDHIDHERTETFTHDYWTEEYGTRRETKKCIGCARNDFPQ